MHKGYRTTLVLTCLILSGCARAPANIALAQSDKPRQTTLNVPESDRAELVLGNSAFAFDLYRAIRSGDGNLFFSPHSLSLALAMTYAGARNETERQMAATLTFTLPQERLHPAFNALDLALAPQEGEGFQLRVANSLWGQADYAFRPDFLDVLAVNYGAGLRLVKFQDEGDREGARLAINDWVADQTEGKIEDLLAEGTLTQDTRLVLANAVYFKAEWEKPFYGTTDGGFTRLDGVTVTVPIMTNRLTAPYVETETYQALEIPYKGGRMRMVILLPAPGQFEAVEQALDAGQFSAILRSLTPADVKPFLPKFSYAASLELKEILADLGMPDAFDPNRADLTGMTDVTRDLPLFIAHAIHEAFVAVDELGTEAAAATGIVGEIVSAPRIMQMDRPFIFAIRDAETGAVLFVGRVLDPTQ